MRLSSGTAPLCGIKQENVHHCFPSPLLLRHLYVLYNPVNKEVLKTLNDSETGSRDAQQ
jgi:hypothetical protein